MQHEPGQPTLESRVHALEQSHLTMNQTVNAMRSELAENTQATASIKSDTATLVEFTKAAQGMVTVGRFFGRVIAWIAKWVAPIVIAGAGLWAVMKGKSPP